MEIKENGSIHRGSNSAIFISASHLKGGQLLKEFLLRRVERVMSIREEGSKLQHLFDFVNLDPLCKIAGNNSLYPDILTGDTVFIRL